jgi:signal transduction histidine kinase
VALRTRRDAEQDAVILEVEDHGSGIAPENLSRVFDPFFSTKEVGKGVGLGLSVVHGIVESHGGAITVQSEPGHGSIFTVQLPVHPRGNGVPGPSPEDAAE